VAERAEARLAELKVVEAQGLIRRPAEDRVMVD
jgi:hypothetical protein